MFPCDCNEKAHPLSKNSDNKNLNIILYVISFHQYTYLLLENINNTAFIDVYGI